MARLAPQPTALPALRRGAWTQRGRQAWRIAQHQPLGVISGLLIAAFVLSALFAEQIAPHDPYKFYPGMKLAAPGTIAPNGALMLVGGDEAGRDLFSRTLFGSRISLSVGISSVAVGVLLGSLLGMVSAYFMGKVDAIIQRLMDAKMAIPTLVFALLLSSIFPRSLLGVTLVIAITFVARASRIVRGSVLSAKENTYIIAARAIGCTDTRVMVNHILPNVTAPIIIIASVDLAGAILIEASLSFLGLGAPPPTPSWGSMISSAGQQYMYRAPLLLIVPSLALSLTVLAFNLLGDTLRDLWDPRLKGS